MVGRTLGHYRILEQIGAGGMGVVYRARDERLDRDVALKVLPPGNLADEDARKRFRNEALALAKLNHPNIASVYDFDTQEDVDFLVMEYIPGETLREKLAAGSLPEKELIHLGRQMAEGLAAAHEQGVVHRDLKPGNLRRTPDGRLKILDFGLAMLLRRPAEADLTASLSDSGVAAGTLPYMAPEQLRDETVDARTDIYAAGAVLYEMATGRRSFEESSGPRLVEAILHRSPAPPSNLNNRISQGLESIILKALDKEPGRRYQSAREMQVDLERLGAPSPETAQTAAALPRAARRATARQIKSLAVLPLANLSRDPEQEYSADGMTEALITDLAKIRALKVISRTSAMRYKGSNKPLREIAAELGVEGVVEGSVLRAGDRVRITAQLVHAATDTHLWAESYERDLRDILALQSEVARAIAREIQVKLSRQERARLTRARRVDPEVHEACLRARYHWNKWTGEGFAKCLEYLHQAVEKDPAYAPAYAALGVAYTFLGYWGYADEREVFPKAKAAALKALELDDTLAEAHYALGTVRWFHDWDLPACEKEYQRALELNPSDAIAQVFYAVFLSVIRADHEGAIAKGREAEALDPFRAILGALVGWILTWARQYDRAIAQSRRVLELDPGCLQAYLVLGFALVQTGLSEEGIAALERGVEISRSPLTLGMLGLTYALSGQNVKAQQLQAELEEKARGEHVPPMCFAWLSIGLGEKDRAFEWLEKAYEERSSQLFWLQVNRFFDPLRSDPRFHDLERRLGLLSAAA